MHILIAIISLAAAVYFAVNRMRNRVHMASDLVDLAADIPLAMRRFGFKRRSNQHPVESVDDLGLAIAGAAMAFQDLDGVSTQTDRARLDLALRRELAMDADTAEEAQVLARWLIAECTTADAAFTRFAKRVRKINGTEAVPPLLAVIKGTVATDSELSAKQKDALNDIQRLFQL